MRKEIQSERGRAVRCREEDLLTEIANVQLMVIAVVGLNVDAFQEYSG